MAQRYFKESVPSFDIKLMRDDEGRAVINEMPNGQFRYVYEDFSIDEGSRPDSTASFVVNLVDLYGGTPITDKDMAVAHNVTLQGGVGGSALAGVMRFAPVEQPPMM